MNNLKNNTDKNDYINIERYSIHGFKPQKQIAHLKEVYYHLNIINDINDRKFDDDLKMGNFPKHLEYEINNRHKYLYNFYKENLEDFKEGIWVFIKGHKNNQSLNHLKYKDEKTGEIKKKLVPCWYGQIPCNTIVYDCNLERKIRIDDPIIQNFGCYIPKKEVEKIKYIHKKH